MDDALLSSGAGGICYIFAVGENCGVAAIEAGGEQQSTGLLHLIVQIPQQA